MDQIGIAIFSVAAIWLSFDPRDRVKRWGPVFGLVSQPFWFWMSYHNMQWAVFMLSFFYTFSWMRGIYNLWYKPWRKHDHPRAM